MESKKKIIIALSAFAMVVLAVVVAVVAVLAAQTVTVSSDITINYTVGDVAAKVEVYAAKAKNSQAITWGTAKSATFDADGYKEGVDATSSASGMASISFSSVNLAKDECVVLKFVFTNMGDKAFTAKLGDITTTNTNVNIYYSATDSNLSSLTSGTKSDVSVVAGSGNTALYFVRIAIADTAKNVTNFKPVFNWTLE